MMNVLEKCELDLWMSYDMYKSSVMDSVLRGSECSIVARFIAVCFPLWSSRAERYRHRKRHGGRVYILFVTVIRFSESDRSSSGESVKLPLPDQ